MDGAMGQEEEVVEAVLTCEGDFHDPELYSRIERFRHRLKDLLLTEKRKLQVKKIEPWNSVKVTFTIPREAAIRLRQLAQTGSDMLRQIGVLSVQIQGDSQISLTIAGHNNEQTEFVLRTPSVAQGASSSLPFNFVGTTESGRTSSDEFGSSPGPSNEEVTRKNIVDYLKKGPALRQNAVLFDSILGAGAAASGLGMGLGVPSPVDTFPGPSGNISAPFRSGNVGSMAAMPNQTIRGSQISSNRFPFSKTTGAFHPPVPRLPSSAGQSLSITTSTHHMQSMNLNPLGPLCPISQPATSLASEMAISNSGSVHHALPANIHNLSPGGPLRQAPISSSANFNSSIPHVPPSTSPSSSFIMDLPPPPPYPYNSGSTSRPGKPVTASSPLLVNLLQTDPLAVVCGMASGNPNKPMTAGDTATSGPPPKKKRRAKKPKEGVVKPIPVCEGNSMHPVITNKPSCFIGARQNQRLEGESGVSTFSDSGPIRGSVDLVQSRAGGIPVTHISESFMTNFHLDNKLSLSADRPFSESHVDHSSTTVLNSGSNVRSAIEAGNASSPISDTNGQDGFPKDGDTFSSEVAAGKIINPYTGQLEPRDSVLEAGNFRLKAQTNVSQEDNFTTQMLAIDLAEMSKKNLPVTSTQMFDVNVLRTVFPSSVSVTASTAAIVSSGGPSQGTSDRLISMVPSHRRNLISDGSYVEGRDVPARPSIYAPKSNAWREEVGNSAPTATSLPHLFSGSLPSRGSVSMSNPSPQSSASSLVALNGPASGGLTLKHNVMLPQHQHKSTSYPLGTERAPSGSVIYSNVTMSSNSTSLPLSLSHQGGFGHLSSQQSAHSPSSLHQISSMVSPSITSNVRAGPSSLTPGAQISERLKLTESNRTFSNQQNPAAGSETVGSCFAASTSTSACSNLLNSIPDKNIDSHSSTESPPDNKLSSEGDENSNHSVTNTDNLPENSGTAVLLEHSGVKSENHDSGVGSSSERSDDTPSEPGDGEFRSAPAGAEVEDGGGKMSSSQRGTNCKLETKVDTSSTTITVGYMMSPSDRSSQGKPTFMKDSSRAVKTPGTSPSSSDISIFLDTHMKSLDKSELMGSAQSMSSINWATDGSNSLPSSFSDKSKHNGPVTEDLANFSVGKMNGPSSHNNLEKMILAMNDFSQKKNSGKHNDINKGQALTDIPVDHLKFQAEVLEKMTKLHHFGESSTDIGDSTVAKSNNADKSDSPDALSHHLISAVEDRSEHLSFLDMEELVNGKLLGNGNGGLESKGGSNITSIYSKRSSPVNVNMLNHIYAPGLPLPRRLTESVQRLVKPLPASESSLPHLRPCKSQGSGGSPRAGSGTIANSSRIAVHSGARSPGASMPKLIQNDKYSLLSGGLDLAGLSSIPLPSSHIYESSESGILVNNCRGSVPSATADVLFRETPSLSSFSSSQQSAPASFDSKSHALHSSKMLSQSYPPHKSRDLLVSQTHMTNDSFLSLLPLRSSVEKRSSSPFFHNQHGIGSRSLNDISKSLTQGPRSSVRPFVANQLSISSSSSSPHVGNHLTSSSNADSNACQPRLASLSTSSDNFLTVDCSRTHSTCSSNGMEALDVHHPAHSSASSPIMPILQRGLEPSLPSALPPTSSQPPPSIVTSAQEISPTPSHDRSTQLLSLVSTAQATTLPNKYVPYSHCSLITGTTSGTTMNFLTSEVSVSKQSLPPSLMTVAKGRLEPALSAIVSQSSSVPPKLTKSHSPINNSLPPSLSRTVAQTASHSRNLFESVTGTLSHQLPPSLKSERYTPYSIDSGVTQNSQCRTSESDSHKDVFSSVLLLKESNMGLTVRNMQQKLSESYDTVLTCPDPSENVKSDSSSKSIHTSVEPPKITSMSTEVVNLDFSTSPFSNLGPMNSMKDSINVLKVNKQSLPVGTTSAAQAISVVNTLPTSFSSTSSLPVDSVSETIASVAAAWDEGPSKIMATSPSSTSSLAPSPIKEPILETLASSLGTAISSVKMPFTKSFLENKLSGSASSPSTTKSTVESLAESKTVTVQSGCLRAHDFSSKPQRDSLTAEDHFTGVSDLLVKRATRKNKSIHSEGEEEPTAPVASVNSEQSLHEEMTSTKVINEPDSKEPACTKSNLKEVMCCHTVKNDDDLKEDNEDAPVENHGLSSEDQELSQRDLKSHPIPSISEDDKLSPTREGNDVSSVSSTMDDTNKDTQPQQPTSTEYKGYECAKTKSHIASMNTVEASPSFQRGNLASSDTVVEKDLCASHQPSPALSDNKEGFQKDIGRFQRWGPKTAEGVSESMDTAGGMELSFEGGVHQEHMIGDVKSTDGDSSKRGHHRVKRQFYAYVPEKSIDQTYFDTPILSGRTRSKNKSSEPTAQLDSTPMSQEGLMPPVGNFVDSQPQQTVGSQQTSSGKLENTHDNGSGKRSTRSLRVKDSSPQDPSAAKRRRGNQREQR